MTAVRWWRQQQLRQTQGIRSQGRSSRELCFPTSHPVSQRPLLVLTLPYPPGPAPGFASGRSQCFSFPLSLKSLTFPTWLFSAAPLCGAAGLGWLGCNWEGPRMWPLALLDPEASGCGVRPGCSPQTPREEEAEKRLPGGPRPKWTSLSPGKGATGIGVEGWGQGWEGQSKTGRSIPVQWLEYHGCLEYIRTTKNSEARWLKAIRPSSTSAQKPVNVTKNTFPSLAYQQQMVFHGRRLCSQQWYLLHVHTSTVCLRGRKDGGRRSSQ